MRFTIIYVSIYIHTYIYICIIICIFPGKMCAILMNFSSFLNYMLPVRPRCLNQVLLGGSGRRTYTVSAKSIMGIMVQCINESKKLCIAWGGGDKAQPIAEFEGIDDSQGRPGNLPKRATLYIVVYVIRTVCAA